MPQGSGLGNLVLLLPLLLLAWMFLSQRKRTKATMEFQNSLAVGAEVVTTFGVYGRIVALDDRIATLEVAPGSTLRVDRRAIGMPAPGAEPAAPGSGSAGSAS